MHLVQVLEVVAGIRREEVEDVAAAVYKNTINMFFEGMTTTDYDK